MKIISQLRRYTRRRSKRSTLPGQLSSSGAGEDQIRRFAYIDALRGYAILMVIAVHSSQYFSDLPGAVTTLANQGARGVQLFFVASALTLSMSWQARHDRVLPFYVRRVFRIAPMFWLAIVFFVMLQGFGPRAYAPEGIGARHVAMAALFLHGLMPDTITSVVPGSWSVADEMIFYAIFPLLIVAMSRLRLSYAVLVTFAATYICYRFNHAIADYVQRIPDAPERGLWAVFTYLWFPQQLPCFLFGTLLFKVSLEVEPSRSAAIIMVVAAVGAMLAIPFLQNWPALVRLGFIIPYGIAFSVFAFGLMHWQPLAFVNPMIGWIGKVSYSAYFIHFALIETAPMPYNISTNPSLNYLVVFVTLAVCAVGASSITYLLIERPAISVGNRLMRWRLFHRKHAEDLPA